jgi:hypothetical protein
VLITFRLGLQQVLLKYLPTFLQSKETVSSCTSHESYLCSLWVFLYSFVPDRLDSSASIEIEATGWTTRIQFLAWARIWFYSSPSRPYRLWCPPSLLYRGYRGRGGGKAAVAWKLKTRLHLVPKLWMRGAIPPLPPINAQFSLGYVFIGQLYLLTFPAVQHKSKDEVLVHNWSRTFK